MIDDEIMKGAVAMNDKERSVIKDRTNSIANSLQRLEDRFKDMTRFRVDEMVRDSNAQLEQIDSFVSESNRQASIHVRAALEAEKLGNDADIPRVGPWFDMAMLLKTALGDLYAAMAYD